MRFVALAAVAVLLPAAAGAQAPSAPAPVPQTPPAAPAAAAAQPPPAPVARTFTAPVGLLFNTVRTDRVKDFETFLSHLQVALDKAATPTVQAQAKGWKFFKAGEPGPNNTVLYVFVLDPAVKDADYSLGRILADAYPDATQLSEIWKLYTSSVTGGGSLLNLNTLTLDPPPASPAAPVAPAR